MSKVYECVCPCKGCVDRILGCHSICEKYKDWKSKGIEIEKTPKQTPFTDFSLCHFSKRKRRSRSKRI